MKANQFSSIFILPFAVATNGIWFTALALSVVGCGKKSTDSVGSIPAATLVASSNPPVPGAASPNSKPGLDSNRAVWSCNMKSKELGMMCSEWTGLSLSELKEAKGSCSDPGSVFSASICPTAGLLATCAHKEEKITSFIYKTAVTPNLKSAKEMCDDGAFTAMVAAAPMNRQ